MTKDSKNIKLPPKKRAVSYDDCPTGLDLTKETARRSSPPPIPPAAASSPGPIDLQVKDDRHCHNNASPPPYLSELRWLHLRAGEREKDQIEASDLSTRRQVNSPPTLPLSRPSIIKEDPVQEQPVQNTRHGDVEIKTEPQGEPERDEMVPAAAALSSPWRMAFLHGVSGVPLQHLNRREYSDFPTQSQMSLLYNSTFVPHGLFQRAQPQLDLGQIRSISGHHPDLPQQIKLPPHLSLLAAADLHNRGGGLLLPGGSRLLPPDVSLLPVKPEARPVAKSGLMIFSPIQNHLDNPDAKRARMSSPSGRTPRGSPPEAAARGGPSDTHSIFRRVTTNTYFDRDHDRDSYSRENGYDDDSCNSEDDVDVGGTPEPPIRPSGFSKQSKFRDEKNIHNYERAERSGSFEGRKNSKDLKRARDHGMEHLFLDIISLPMEEFQDLCQRENLSPEQCNLAREFRRRGKNKVAAQNCRKRKLEQVHSLEEKTEMVQSERKHFEEELRKAEISCEEKINEVRQLIIKAKVEGKEVYCTQCKTIVRNCKEDEDCYWMHTLTPPPSG